MKKVFLTATFTAATVVSSAGAAELPTFELIGLPITRHQVAVMGATNIQERSPNQTRRFDGMPASPRQIAVLTPRPGIAERAGLEGSRMSAVHGYTGLPSRGPRPSLVTQLGYWDQFLL
jgi:hypothetical protein